MLIGSEPMTRPGPTSDVCYATSAFALIRSMTFTIASACACSTPTTPCSLWSVILVVPMCLLCSIVGIGLARMEVTVFTQIGFVVLVGLASKNAILIVEFAKQLQDQGKERFEATVQASKQRLRPILMTSFAFILGVVPLVLAKGAGAEMRVAIGIAVFSGMLGVTIFGIFFTPVFYLVIRWMTEVRSSPTDSNVVHAKPADGDGVKNEEQGIHKRAPQAAN